MPAPVITHDEFSVLVKAGTEEDLTFPSVSPNNTKHIGFLGVPNSISSEPKHIERYLKATLSHAKKKRAELLAIKARPGQEKIFERVGFVPYHQLTDRLNGHVDEIFGRPERRQGVTTYVMELA